MERRIQARVLTGWGIGGLLVFAGLLGATTTGCEDSQDGTSGTTRWVGRLADTFQMGKADNAEAVRVLPGGQAAVLLSSKARKATLFRITNGRLVLAREKAFYPADPSESEMTNLDVSSDGTWAVATRTILEVNGEGQQVRCGGMAVFFDITDRESFGTILAEVEVGPMPDAVDISDDDRLVAVANERDGPDAWGKCEVPGATPSISILELSAGPTSAREQIRIPMKDGGTGPREPESIVFSKDHDLVVTTLQDSHEVALFRVSEVAGKAAPSSDDLRIVPLPANALGAPPWPDGVARCESPAGNEFFVVAGEWNDTFSILDGSGTIRSTTEVSPRDIPASLPRVIDEGSPLFSPDSVACFVLGGRVYGAFTLRHAGAVAVYDLSAPEAPVFVQAIAVGREERGAADENGSTVRPEGISATSDGGVMVVANEQESSLSLILPL